LPEEVELVGADAGRRLKVHRARLAPDGEAPATPGTLEGVVVATGAGGLELVDVQPEGKPVQAATSWRNGAHLAPGDRLGA
jgi:methionyl-tRNA formyltransferase